HGKREAKVKSRRTRGRGSAWFLPGPVVISTPAESLPGATPTVSSPLSEYPGHVRKPHRTGRKPDPETERLYKVCYDEYVVKDRTRSQVSGTAHKECPGGLPRGTEEEIGRAVTEYAKRFAKRYDPPLPMDPDKAKAFRQGGQQMPG